MKFLLDTNVLSEPLRRTPNRGVIEHLRAHEYALATAAPVWHELIFGASRLPKSRRRSDIERFLRQVVAQTMPILPYDQAAAAWHATERARLTRQGRNPPFVDGQIAAIALMNGLVLVTANVADYADFDGLTVEDWRTR